MPLFQLYLFNLEKTSQHISFIRESFVFFLNYISAVKKEGSAIAWKQKNHPINY